MKLINEHVHGDSGVLTQDAKEALSGFNDLRRLAIKSALKRRKESRNPNLSEDERVAALRDVDDFRHSSGSYRESIVERIKDELELARGFAKRL